MLKELEKSKFEKVTLVYFAESISKLPFLAEVEYWQKSTQWSVDVTVASDAPKDWQHKVAEMNTAAVYQKLPNATRSVAVFASVSYTTRPDLSDRLVARGYQATQINWLN